MSEPSTSEPVRIRDDGREGDRALLRAGPPAPPPGLQDFVRRSIEQRAAAPRSRRWWAVGLFGLLGAGTAFALGTSPGRQLLRDLLGPPAVVEAPLESAAHRPDWQPLPAPPPPPPPTLTPTPAARPLRPAKPEPSPPSVILQPGLRQPPGEWSMSGATGEPDRRPPPAPSLLRITYRGRTTALRATASTIDGHLRGATVSLRFDGSRLTGKIGDQPIRSVPAPRSGAGHHRRRGHRLRPVPLRRGGGRPRLGARAFGAGGAGQGRAQLPPRVRAGAVSSVGRPRDLQGRVRRRPDHDGDCATGVRGDAAVSAAAGARPAADRARSNLPAAEARAVSRASVVGQPRVSSGGWRSGPWPLRA